MNTIIDNATISALPVTTTAIRRTAAVAALILGMQVVAACSSEQAATDAVDSGSSSVKVQGFAGSADALERRASAKSGNRFGSADALERRLGGNHGAACLTSADAAERLGKAPC